MYIYGSRKPPGPSAMIGQAEAILLQAIALRRPKPTVSEMCVMLSDEVGGHYPVLSEKTVAHAIKKRDISAQQTSFYSALLDENQRRNYMKIIEHVHPNQLHNWDETSGAHKKFVMRTAYDKVGITPVEPEWTIEQDGKVYSVIADYTPDGFDAYRIFKCNITMNALKHFCKTIWTWSCRTVTWRSVTVRLPICARLPLPCWITLLTVDMQ